MVWLTAPVPLEVLREGKNQVALTLSEPAKKLQVTGLEILIRDACHRPALNGAAPPNRASSEFSCSPGLIRPHFIGRVVQVAGRRRLAEAE